jgi:hypothetical protein
MSARACLILLIASFAGLPAMSQVQPEAAGGEPVVPEDNQMMTPPPASGAQYPNITGADLTTNNLHGVIAFDTAYIDNLLPGAGTAPVADTTFSIHPDFRINRTTSLRQLTLRYSPSFTFYEPTSVLDSMDQSAAVNFQQRLSPHIAISLDDFFLRTSNVYSASYPFATGGITGAPQAQAPAVIAPFAEMMTETADASLTYQFGKDGMIGGGGNYSKFEFPKITDAEGLFDSTGEVASAFYSRRLTPSHYIGVTYDYGRSVVSSPNAPIETQLHTPLPFYTFYFNRSSSISFAGGMQYTSVTQGQKQAFSDWTPAGSVSFGWQSHRAVFAASYLHTVTSGQGLYGAFYLDSVGATGYWNFSRTLSGAVGTSYTNTSALSQLDGLAYNGGDTFTAHASMKDDIGKSIEVEFGYDRLQEKYNGIAVITQNPNNDRVFVTLIYVINRPVGR